MFNEPISQEVIQHQDTLASQHGHLKTGKRIEVLLHGAGIKEHIQAKISRHYARKSVSVDSTSYFYPVNVSVKQG